MFSFLSKDIVIHSISRILGSTNVLHCNAKGIGNYFCNCLTTFVVAVFFFSKARSSLKCVYDLTDGFMSTARF